MALCICTRTVQRKMSNAQHAQQNIYTSNQINPNNIHVNQFKTKTK